MPLAAGTRPRRLLSTSLLLGGSWLSMAGPAEPTEKEALEPAPRFAHAMTYDAERERVVIFGGTTGKVGEVPMLRDTWEWDGSRWHQVDIPGPEPRAYAAMAFDPSRKVVVLNGGRRDDNGTFADTWEYDGIAWNEAVENGPVGRDHHALVYDSGRQVLLTFGGWDGEATHDDLWQWDGSEWQLISTGGPPHRSAYGMVWDEHRETVLVYGGTNVQARHADLWEWDGRSWRLLTDPYTNPNRSHFTPVYDPTRKTVLAFGGLDRRQQASGATLILLGNRFHRLDVDGPSSRYNHGMVRTGTAGSVFLFGGCDRPGGEYRPMGDAWIWTGDSWIQISVKE